MARTDTLKNFLVDIADKFREKLGITGAISHADYDTKIEEVYEAGYTKGQSEGGGGECTENHLSLITDWSCFFAKQKQGNSSITYDANSALISKLKYSDTSNGTKFYRMFYHSTAQYIPAFDVSKATELTYIFSNCSSLVELPLLETSHITSFSGLAHNCKKIKQFPNYDLSSATNISSMLYGCAGIENFPSYDTSNVVSFGSLFYGCTSLVNVPRINFSKMKYQYYTDYDSIFANCSSLVNIGFEGTFPVSKNITLLSTAPNVNQESLHKLIECLVDNSTVSTTYKVYIGSTNLAKVSADYLEIAAAKNISLQ